MSSSWDQLTPSEREARLEEYVDPSVPLDRSPNDEAEVAVLRGVEGGRYVGCPFCGFECTHVDEVTAARESGSSVRATTLRAVDGESRTETFAMDANSLGGPAISSHAKAGGFWIEIHFDCEGCLGGSLVLAQHKGATEWRLVPTPRPSSARVRRPQID